MRNRKITYVFIVLSLVMIGIGVLRSETAEVWMKSTKICLECIGIG